MATPAADPPGCVAALAAPGCDCTWAAAKNHAPLQGLGKAGAKDAIACPTSGPDVATCQAASASPAACEAFCCHGADGSGPPMVTSAPQPPLVQVTGPCGQWQFNPEGDLNGGAGCEPPSCRPPAPSSAPRRPLRFAS